MNTAFVWEVYPLSHSRVCRCIAQYQPRSTRYVLQCRSGKRFHNHLGACSQLALHRGTPLCPHQTWISARLPCRAARNCAQRCRTLFSRAQRNDSSSTPGCLTKHERRTGSQPGGVLYFFLLKRTTANVSLQQNHFKTQSLSDPGTLAICRIYPAALP